MRVGLLGGSFNPPHLGHIHISKLAIKKLSLDQVWWIPTAKNPLKNAAYENYEKRVAKSLKIIAPFPKIHLLQLDEIHTEKLIRRLKTQYKDHEFFWIMGADNLKNFHLWQNFKKLIKMIPLAVFSRETFLKSARKTKIFSIIKNYQKTDNKLPKLLLFRDKNLDISSTQIRQKNELYNR